MCCFYILIEPKKPAKHAILLILLIKQAKIKAAENLQDNKKSCFLILTNRI